MWLISGVDRSVQELGKIVSDGAEPIFADYAVENGLDALHGVKGSSVTEEALRDTFSPIILDRITELLATYKSTSDPVEKLAALRPLDVISISMKWTLETIERARTFGPSIVKDLETPGRTVYCNEMYNKYGGEDVVILAIGQYIGSGHATEEGIYKAMTILSDCLDDTYRPSSKIPMAVRKTLVNVLDCQDPQALWMALKLLAPTGVGVEKALPLICDSMIATVDLPFQLRFRVEGAFNHYVQAAGDTLSTNKMFAEKLTHLIDASMIVCEIKPDEMTSDLRADFDAKWHNFGRFLRLAEKIYSHPTPARDPLVLGIIAKVHEVASLRDANGTSLACATKGLEALEAMGVHIERPEDMRALAKACLDWNRRAVPSEQSKRPSMIQEFTTNLVGVFKTAFLGASIAGSETRPYQIIPDQWTEFQKVARRILTSIE